MLISTLLFILCGSLLHQVSYATPGTPGNSQDPSSASNLDVFKPLHIYMDYMVDFQTSTTSGTITHTITVVEPNVTTLYMDVWDAVKVSKAEFKTDGTDFVDVDYDISTPNPNTGMALGISLPVEMPVGTIFYVRLTYVSLPESKSLDWMTPEQTAGGKLPFVYSLCQMNFCRDWAPMMDSPSNKITYNASILAPNEFVVSMTGNETGKTPYNDTWSTTTFESNIKIPSYLIAMIVGDLKKVELSDRITIYAEEPYIDAAAKEFEDLPAILDAAEEYLTPYIWGKYTTFVMPPSFAWGGMEHPNANIVTHTLLTGDKSMVPTAIHELTHSWFGNEVGCQNWNHMWINEGMNVFMERKIQGLFYGEEFSKIKYYLGNTTMYYEYFLSYGLNDSYSALYPDIGTDDPENSFSKVPYEKGSQFMYYVESLLGVEGMQKMLRAYIHKFSQDAINETEFEAFYNDFVMETFSNGSEIVNATMWHTWVHEPGNGPVTIDIQTDALLHAQTLAEEYVMLEGTASPLNYDDFFGYYAFQQVAFVDYLDASDSDAIDSDLLAYIDSDLDLTTSANPLVKTAWYKLGIKYGYDAVLEPTHIWLGQQGKKSYCYPLYKRLVEAGQCELAIQWYEEYADFYNYYIMLKTDPIIEPCYAEVSDVAVPSITWFENILSWIEEFTNGTPP